jgi:hypothetical protein
MKKQKRKPTLNEIYEAIQPTLKTSGTYSGEPKRDTPNSKTDDTDNKTIVQKDTEAANRIKLDMIDVLKGLDSMFNQITGELSQFNSPGLREAFREAIKIGLTNRNGFNTKGAIDRLTEWYRDDKSK